MPPLLVVRDTDDARAALTDASDSLTIRSRQDLDDALASRLDARQEGCEHDLAELQAERPEVRATAVHAVAAADAAMADLERLRAQADWCEEQPGDARATAARIAEVSGRIRELHTTARDANRALDAVLEQRATAEAALREARLELEAHADLSSSESEVRAALEEASRAIAEAADIQTKARAERDAEVFQRRLAVRADGGIDAERLAAVEALARQAGVVEQRLNDAVSEASRAAEAANADLAEVEQLLERLHETDRRRRPQLLELVELLPRDRRPAPGDDPLLDVDTIAAGLRQLADNRLPNVEDLLAKAGHANEVLHDLDDRIAEAKTRAQVTDADVAEEVREAIRSAPTRLVVLDHPVSDDRWEIALDALAAWAADDPAQVVVLMSDAPSVHAWAIDLPADVGRIGGARDVHRLLQDEPSPPAPAEPTVEVPPAPADRSPSSALGLGIEDLIPKRVDRPQVTPEPEPVAQDGPIVTLERLRAFAFTSPTDEEHTTE